MLTWGRHTEQEWHVCVRALLPLVPQIAEGIPLAVLDGEGRRRAGSSGSNCRWHRREVEVVVCGEPLPEVVDLARLRECLSAGSGVRLVNPEFELGTRRRAEGGGVEVGRRGWGRNDGRVHPFGGGWIGGSVGYCNNKVCAPGQRWRDSGKRDVPEVLDLLLDRHLDLFFNDIIADGHTGSAVGFSLQESSHRHASHQCFHRRQCQSMTSNNLIRR